MGEAREMRRIVGEQPQDAIHLHRRDDVRIVDLLARDPHLSQQADKFIYHALIFGHDAEVLLEEGNVAK